ncbi:MAG TPA: WxcM-like domain-containing protein [Solirubrobacteraceae bacterium]|nr:WxcM-like domain-containing protein [Solirubrobacteraceae bacterium]
MTTRPGSELLKDFRHPYSLCESELIGPRTRIQPFVHVLAEAQIGADCEIGQYVLIESDVVIGDRVTIKRGVSIWDGLRIEDDVFIGPNTTFTNDRFPRSSSQRFFHPRTVVCKGASLGACCTVLPGLTIGAQAMVGAGSVITRNVPAHAIVAGNPARIIGYADTARHSTGRATQVSPATNEGEWPMRLNVGAVTLHRLAQADDMRGSLVSGEIERHLPFVPQRFFTVMKVPSKDARGAHAHRLCDQFLVCQAGSLAVVVDDGRNREEVVLDDPSLGLYLPAMTWGVQYRYTAEALLLVLASRPYEPEDYIRDYDDFLAIVSNRMQEPR